MRVNDSFNNNKWIHYDTLIKAIFINALDTLRDIAKVF